MRAGRLGWVALLCCAAGIALALGGWSWFGQTPEEVVRTTLETLREPTDEDLQGAATAEIRERLEGLGLDARQLIVALYGHLGYENLEATMTGTDAAVVECDVTNVDLADVLQRYVDASTPVSKGEGSAEGTLGAGALVALMEAPDAKTATNHVSLELRRVDGEWRLADPGALVGQLVR